MSKRIVYTRAHPSPAYTGPQPRAEFSTCPVSTASLTRDGAVMAFDYYHNRLRAG